MPEFLQKLIAGLSDRERRLVLFTGAAFVVFIIFLIVFFVQSGISDLSDETDSYVNSLELITKKEQAYLDGKQDKQRGTLRSKPTPLRTLVDKIGRQVSVNVPDMKELPDQRHQGSWLEHGVELSMREIGIQELVKFMEAVEGNKRRFPIAITKLEIRKRKRVQNAYDVKMIIATYEKTEKEDGDGMGKHSGGAKRKGGR